MRRRGYTLTATDGRLNVSPGSRLTEGEREEIAAHKAELLALLGRELPPGAWDDQDREMVRLAACGAFQWWVPGIADRMAWEGNHVRADTDDHAA